MSAYSFMAVSFLSVTGVSGQVAYTDVDPDQTFDSDGLSYDLDLNFDGNTDYSIKVVDYMVSSFFSSSSGSVFSGAVRGVFVIPYNGNAIAGYGNSSFANPYAFDSGVFIGSSLPFQVAPIQSLLNYQVVYDYPAGGSIYVYASYGYWANAVDKFLVLQFNFGGDIYYGFARLDVSDNHHQFTIKDYGYNTIAGEGFVFHPEFVSDNYLDQMIGIYSYVQNIFVQLKDENLIGSTATVFDISGKVLLAEKLNNTETIISMAQFPTTTYIVQIMTDEGDAISKQLFCGN